jgi:hypothetical protein
MVRGVGVIESVVTLPFEPAAEVVQAVTRFAALTDPRPTAKSYPAVVAYPDRMPN